MLIKTQIRDFSWPRDGIQLNNIKLNIKPNVLLPRGLKASEVELQLDRHLPSL
jgi:hypothetical protein